MLLLLLCGTGQLFANTAKDAQQTVEQYRVDEMHAARFGLLPVQASNGRMMPVNTFLQKYCVNFIRQIG